ncbi:S24 family peptidase [Ralstonia pseudosolanacearum]|uniref:S24 family peptidase n=1 Tax=Ralstonia pseudosolanacearum TaxID=1310165 RepID=UPI002674FBDB|nr:S24 family peptidase [Ralstonia pseudosolanacearum]MDO3524522.1 S24 family peptidase [Ralstonia pseudosolanacearum]MDO3552422.1 S24 family peptidase [Ralstonia pseudosolanacearum]MDO3591243.1 S24 family peptidase [Ralstonia pseudosolanacearum]MDO3595733.1 S24 family peptidase [Ralstonia pseudosolanacearum]MDO3601260.1 S24 family peptidase [Ralstonia pseudosolanacearum]
MNEKGIQDWRTQRLKAAVDKIADGNVTAFGKRLGYKDGAFVRQMLSGNRPVSEKTVRAIEDLPGLANWFSKKLDLPSLSSPQAIAEWEAQQAEESLRMAKGDETALRAIAESKGFPARPISVYDSLEELLPETTVLITHVDVALSAGHGRETWHIEEKEPLPFQADYIRRLDASPKNLVAVKVRGDSMEPRLFDDDTVVVDKADRRIPAGGGVFALVYAGEMLVKRLFRLPDGSLRVVSDNKEKHDPFVVAPGLLEHIDIVGRVKYRSGMGDF